LDFRLNPKVVPFRQFWNETTSLFLGELVIANQSKNNRKMNPSCFFKLKQLYGLFALLCLPFLSLGQSQTALDPTQIQIGDEILIDFKLPNRQLIEPRIATHPTVANHLIAVGWVMPTSGDRHDLDVESCAVFFSKDGGKSWNQGPLLGRGCADPWITLSEKGALLTSLGTHPSLPDSDEDQLLAYFSFNGGETWSLNPQSLGYFHDGPRSVANQQGTTYVISSQSTVNERGKPRFPIYIGRAKAGQAFVDKRTSITPSNLNLNSDGIATLADGTLLVSYQDFQRPVNGFRNRGRRGVLKTRREWVVTSEDGGLSFSEPKLITEACFDRAGDLAVDLSKGAFHDRIYCICSGSDYKSILLSSSHDQGEEWTDAEAIELPDTLKGIRREPQLAVNNQGILAVAWMDGRDAPDRKCFTPYITFSSDGGQSFSPVRRVGEALSCPKPAEAGIFVPRRWPSGGDYFGLASAADGRFHLLWADARTGKFQLYTAAISVLGEK